MAGSCFCNPTFCSTTRHEQTIKGVSMTATTRSVIVGDRAAPAVSDRIDPGHLRPIS